MAGAVVAHWHHLAPCSPCPGHDYWTCQRTWNAIGDLYSTSSKIKLQKMHSSFHLRFEFSLESHKVCWCQFLAAKYMRLSPGPVNQVLGHLRRSARERRLRPRRRMPGRTPPRTCTDLPRSWHLDLPCAVRPRWLRHSLRTLARGRAPRDAHSLTSNTSTRRGTSRARTRAGHTAIWPCSSALRTHT